MSEYVGEGEPCVVWTETTVRARVEHACTACGEAIRPGDTYTRHIMISKGERPDVVKRCTRCQRLYEHLQAQERDHDYQTAPRLDCGHTYDELHGEPPPAEIAALAFWLPGDERGKR